MGFNALQQCYPRHYSFHLAQENLPAGLTFLAGVIKIGKGGLARHSVYKKVVRMLLLSQIWRFVQRFLSTPVWFMRKSRFNLLVNELTIAFPSHQQSAAK